MGVRAPRRCTPAVLGSSELRRSELSSADRAPRGCQGSSSVSASAPCLSIRELAQDALKGLPPAGPARTEGAASSWPSTH